MANLTNRTGVLLPIMAALLAICGSAQPRLGAQVESATEDAVFSAAARHLRGALDGAIALDPRWACTLVEQCNASPHNSREWGPRTGRTTRLLAESLEAVVRAKESVVQCPASGHGCRMADGIDHQVAFGSVLIDNGTASVRVYRVSRRDPVAGSSILDLFYEYDATLIFAENESGQWSFVREDLVRVS